MAKATEWMGRIGWSRLTDNDYDRALDGFFFKKEKEEKMKLTEKVKEYIAGKTQTTKGLGWEIIRAEKGPRRGTYLVCDRQSGLCRVATDGDFLFADDILAIEAAQGHIDYTSLITY